MVKSAFDNGTRSHLDNDKIIYQLGIPEHFRAAAVELFDQAFGEKFSVAINAKEKRMKLLFDSFILDHAIAAIHNDQLIGIAGFQTPKASFTSGMTYEKLLTHLGFLNGHWAVLIFSLFERQALTNELVMDGIAVDKKWRGRGIGGQLLEGIMNYAQKQQYQTIRLDVIDINYKAKKLYLQKGFQVKKEEYFPYLRWLLGFAGSTTMEYRV